MTLPRFVYHASAVGLAATIRRPFQETLESQAVSALPPSGGYSSARRTNVRIREFLTSDVVRSEAAGSYSPESQTFDTFASASVENFNLADVVRAELITSHISSSHSAVDDVDPLITPLGSGIRKLYVAGQEVELESLVGLYNRLNTMDKLRSAYASDKSLRGMLDGIMMTGKKAAIADSRLHRFFPWCHQTATESLPEYRRLTVLPLYRIVTPASSTLRITGNVIHVENFARVQVGEIIVGEYERRITGLRVEFGSAVEGDTECGAVNGNGGNTTPP